MPREKSIIRRHRGFTLIELVLVIVIIGILAAVAMRSGSHIAETSRVEETKQELDDLAYAIVGNATEYNIGAQANLGYVGDVGSLPPNLDALVINPGSYTTWKGPYIQPRFSQIASDYKTDAWGLTYAYGGISITSVGSGSNIIRQLATTSDHILNNTVTGTILDRDGTPPGSIYKDSLSVRFTFPDGAGGLTTRTMIPDMGGYFSIDSIPIGNHAIDLIYLPQPETLSLFVAVPLHSSPHGSYRLAGNYWAVSADGTIIAVGDTATTSAQPSCDKITLQIINTGGSPIDVNSIKLTWSSPTGYYKKVQWSGSLVVNAANPRPGSGDVAIFDATQTINAGDTVSLAVEQFQSTPVGGPKVSVENVIFTIELSDGSVFTVTSGTCL